MNPVPAGTLACPNCGAPTAAGSARCDYCHAALATVSCPFCFELLFQGSAFCPHCGHARSRAEVSAPQSTKCPACRGEMRWVKVGAIDLLECGTCDGTWLEAAAFERLCADREGQAAVMHQDVSGRVTAGASSEAVRYRPCPKCGKLMNRTNFGRLSGTVVDICRGHGTFLDRGELHQVVQFILDGGLDRARQREREQLAEDQKRLSHLEHNASTDAELSPGWTGHALQKFLASLLER